MAEFYRGFVFERDVSAPLTIEGNPVRVKRGPDGSGFTAKLPSGETINAASVSEVARRYIIQSGDLARRNLLTKKHLQKLCEGRAAWNRWRRENPHIKPVLANEDLSVEFKKRTLARYDFSYTNLCQARMQGLHLEHANFHQAILAQADLSGAHLEGANFCRTDLYETNFQNAFLARANLQGVQMVRTDLAGADLRSCKVYGLSAWDLYGNAERLVRLTKGKEGVVYGGGNSATQAVIGAVRNGAKKITIISRHALEHGASADQVERLEALQREGKVKILTDEIKRLIPGEDGKVAAVETKGGEVIKAAHVETFLDSKRQLIVRYRPSYARRSNRDDEEVQVESLDLAAFMYLTLNNRNISRIIEAAGRKWVLLLGRFTQRKSVLTAIAEALKQRQLTPIIFDFPPPERRDLIETVMLLAGMSALVIVEITSPRSTPMELQAIASNYGVPVVPVMKQGAKEFGTFSGLRKFPWVHPTITYHTPEGLIAKLQKDVIRRLTAPRPMV